MDNTMKLLLALCKYWGIEVEEIEVNKRELLCNDKPTGRMTYDYIDYKLSKKENGMREASIQSAKEAVASWCLRCKNDKPCKCLT